MHHPKIVEYIGSDFLVFPFLQTIKTNTIGTLNMLGEIFIFWSCFMPGRPLH